MLFNKKDFDSKQRFSIRKLSVGVCSVLLSTLFLTFNEGQTVHASTDANAADATTTSVASNTTNNSSDNNTDKKDDSKVEASSLATAEKHAPIPIAAEVKSNKSEDQTNSASAETDAQASKSNQEQGQTTTNKLDTANAVKAADAQVATSSNNTSNTTSSKDSSAHNKAEENKLISNIDIKSASQISVSDKKSQNSNDIDSKNIKPVTPHADSTENIAPVSYDINGTSPAYVVAGTNLKDQASKFISNAAALTAKGATFSWLGDVPTPTQQDGINGTTITGTIKVTYADGTSTTVDIESYVETKSQLQPNTFYYVNNVGDTPDFSTADANGNDYSTILANTYALIPEAFSYKVLGTIDTSSVGIHWADIQVTDNNHFGGNTEAPKVIGDSYVVKIPYVVQGLKLRDDIPVDANGNPVINAQLATMPQSTDTTPTTPTVAFDPSGSNHTVKGLWGQYFYQDYALAYALGIKVTASNWSAPTDLVNTKTNHFTMTFNNLPNATQQNVEVNYVGNPKAKEMYIFNAPNRTYLTGRADNEDAIKGLFADGYMNDKVWVTLADGTKVYASELDFLDNGQKFIVVAPKTGKYNINFNASFDQTNSAGQPLIFSNNIFNTASSDFNRELNKWYQQTNNDTVADYTTPTATTWDKVSTQGTSFAPTMKAQDTPEEHQLTDGPYTFDSNALGELVKNPSTGAEVKKVQSNWLPSLQPNPILDNNTKWPEGTKFTWLGSDGSTKLTFDKAGESKTGDVKITLSSGSTYTVKDITVISKANVIAKSETVDYGTTLTAEDLVTNKNVFPAGTTYQFVENSEPTWGGTAGSYDHVKITATYPGPDGKPVTTDVAKCAVAINDSRSIKVLAGSDVPSLDSVLNLPSNWEEHTASWTTPINTASTNEGLITIHYLSSNLDQKIKVYVTVIPKTTAVDGQNFFTNGNKYDGTEGSIANGNNQGAILTQANGQAIDYTAYSGSNTPGVQTAYTTKTTNYTPTYSLSGLETNSDGSLVSGVQTATIRVSVPKETIGAKVDADDNYYYELNAKVNIAQPVTFEFVDEYNNDQVVGQTYSQEFVPGIDIYITFHDEDSNTNLGTVEVAGFTAGNGGYYPNINTKLTFPEGANAGDYYSVSTSGVPDGVKLDGSYGTSLTNPTADWTNPNYKWENTFSVLKALTGATMTINLKHKVDKTQENQMRKATVNYVKAKVNADGTYTQDGNAFTSAVLDVYYSRTKSEDLVTKQVTYTPWLWDTNQGDRTTPGYHVVSGTWTSLPQHWAAVVADVPTLDGYTAATVTDKSGKPANQFVFPTWNGSDQDTSNINKESLAYTENAPIYEARPVHTVLYIPNEQQARTITAKYVIAGGNNNGQKFAPDSQIQIFYDRIGSLNVANNKITYGDWQWDNTAGDKATPGFHVISGSWSLPTNGSTWQVNIPNSGNDYVVANLRYDAAYSTFTLAAPSYHTNDVFTSPTSDEWYTRNTLVTYYVPTSMVNKTVTRTIKISEPGQDSKTITQTAKLTRQVRVNQDDTGVVYDGFAGSGWSTGTWGAQDVTTHDGYTMSATQTVNGVTTPIQLVNGQVPAEAVDGNTQNTTINITWGAVATATLTGNGTSTYNGQAITNAELNNALKVNVTGPTAGAGTYTLQAGDVEFSTDGRNWTTALPINAGNYQVRLTAQGKNGIIAKYGNDSIIWTQNGQSTITSNATYMINKLAGNAVMANAQIGNYEMTYNGAAPSTIDPSKFVFTTTVNGQNVELDVTGLDSSDFTWADSSAPVNVGTYKVILTDAGLAKLNANNTNFDLIKAGNGTFTINQANASATLSGSGMRPYNGHAVSVDDLNVSNDNNNITLTLHYPKDGNGNYSTTVKLNAGDFTWNTPNGQAPVNADSQPYTITLNSDAIEGIIKQAVGSGQNDVSNVKFANDAISGSANYTITPLESSAELSNITDGNYTKVYNAEVTNQIDASKLHITANLGGQSVDLNTDGITGSDYQWVDASGAALTSNPKNVGTYYIKLNKDAFARLQAQNPNFKLTSNDGLGIYTITQANATGELVGSNNKVYNGSAISLTELNSNGSIKVTLNFPGVNGQTYILKNGDYTISGNATDAGEYTVTLTDTGKTNVENYIKSLVGTGQDDESNVAFTDNAINGNASFEINKSANTVSVSGIQTETYNGLPINVVYNVNGTNSVKVAIAQASGNTTGAVASLTDVALNSDDFEIVNGPAENAGSYQIKLTNAGLAKIQNTVGDNYSISVDPNTFGTLVINKYKASAELSGSVRYDFTGVAVSPDEYLRKFTLKLNEPKNPTYNLVVGDVEFGINNAGTLTWTTQTPSDVGQYPVRLTKQGWDHIKAINSANVEWPENPTAAGKPLYTIDQVQATATLSGHNSMIYNRSAVTTANLYAGNSTINVAINGPRDVHNLPTSFTLEDGDYVWQTEDGNAPVNVGTYTIKLTAAGIHKIQVAIDQAVGAGNVTLVTTTDNGGSASFEIKQAVAANVQLYGGENTIYNGNPVSFDPTNAETANNFGFHNVENLTVPTFTASDFTWYDGQGNKLSSAPTNAGTYYIALTVNGLKKLQADNPNYAVSESGQFTYVISPAEENVTVSGSQESTSTSIDNANFTVHAPAGVTVPAGITYEFATGVPSESGVYVIKLTPKSITALEKANPNYKLDISSDAKFILDAILNIEFEDTQDGNKQVGKTITKTGVAGSTIDDLKLVVPENYELAPDQELPTSYTFGKTLNQNLYIKLVHKLNELNPTDPSTNPDPTNKNWFRENGLVKDVTRTINYEGLSTAQLAQIPETQKAQTVEFTRTAKYDLVTGKIVVNSEGSWTAVDGKDIFAGFTPFAFAGYTAAPAKVEQVKVTGNDKNSQITVTYTANNQTGKISYVDSDGKEIGQTTISGKTGETVKVTPEAPRGWQIVSGQDIPETVVATPTGVPTVVVKVTHSTITVTPETPEKDIPTGPVPGDPSKNYEKMASLTADPTRTIVVTDPSGKQTTVTQIVNFTRRATFDEVTGEITYSDWTSSEPAEWQAYTAPEVAGYTATSSVSAKTVVAETKNETVNISYTANNQTGKISYVDSDGKEVGQTTISGKTGETVKITPEAPTGWRIVSGQDIPETVVATPTGVPTVVVKVAHSTITVTPETPEKDIPTGPVPGDPSKNYEKLESLTADPTRTIVVTDPSGKQTMVTQTVNFTRTATFDEVTGEITYSDWTSSEPAEWQTYIAPEVAGYTATSNVTVKPVTAETKNEAVSISYTANTQTGKISYVDSDGKEVGQTAISGKTGETVKVTPEVPSGWQIVSGQDIPKTIIATPTGVPTVVVKVAHSTITVTPETPEDNIPTGPVPGDPSKNYEKLGSLTSTPTRTIVVTDPSGKQTRVTQTVNFTRTATFDEVTGEITYSDWKNSEPAEWQTYIAPEVAGYTATSSVSAKPVTAETKNETVNISYTANTQTGKITYVDGGGKEVGQTALTGKTDQRVEVNPEAPTGWQIVPGQDIPGTITATATGVPTVVVKVEHSTITVTPETPEKDIPTGPVPGDPSKNYEKLASLTSTPTRTIVVTDPSGKQTRVTQTVNFTRTATFDEVTGGITYSDWKLQKSTAASHVAQWDSYTPQVITHYVPSVAEVPVEKVNANTADSQVTITYAPASESQVIRYVDKNGKEIGMQIVPGKYGVDTTFTPKLPNNWQSTDTLPTSVKIGENSGSTIVIIEAKTETVQQTKMVTEIIHYHTTDGKQLFADKEMKVDFTRTGVKNLVTGEITWNSWNKDEASFNEVLSPAASGYTASPAKVAAQTVTPNSKDLVFNVTYTKNSQTHPTIPENKPNKPQEENTSKQETKTQDELIHEYGYKKRADGRLVDHTGHVYPAGSKVKENGAIYSEKGELLSVGSRRKHELPQTGLHDNSLIAAIGSLLAGISIFGLLGGRKKKDDDK